MWKQTGETLCSLGIEPIRASELPALDKNKQCETRWWPIHYLPQRANVFSETIPVAVLFGASPAVLGSFLQR